MIQKIATAAVYVDDVQRAVDFWSRQVGFEVRQQRPMGPTERWIELAPPGAESCLVIYPKSMMKDWAERKPSIVFECDDIQSTYEAMNRRGVQFRQQPTQMPWGPFAILWTWRGTGLGCGAMLVRSCAAPTTSRVFLRLCHLRMRVVITSMGRVDEHLLAAPDQLLAAEPQVVRLQRYLA